MLFIGCCQVAIFQKNQLVWQLWLEYDLFSASLVRHLQGYAESAKICATGNKKGLGEKPKPLNSLELAMGIEPATG